MGRMVKGGALRKDGVLQRMTLLAACAAVALLSAGLGGCASMSENMSRSMSTLPGVGLPANAPERPAETLAFPAVHDMPPRRTTAVLTAEEQRSMERDLVAVRATQRPSKPAQPAAEPAAKPAPKPAIAARARQVSPQDPAVSMPEQPPSSRMIY
jgi:hypothetical protein